MIKQDSIFRLCLLSVVSCGSIASAPTATRPRWRCIHGLSEFPISKTPEWAWGLHKTKKCTKWRGKVWNNDVLVYKLYTISKWTNYFVLWVVLFILCFFLFSSFYVGLCKDNLRKWATFKIATLGAYLGLCIYNLLYNSENKTPNDVFQCFQTITVVIYKLFEHRWN